MTVTLKPVLEALGYTSAAQQRGLVKLMQASGAFGEVQGVGDVLTDKQADAILNCVTFNNLQQAAEVLHQATQKHMITRKNGMERFECEELEAFKNNRGAMLQALRDCGMLDNVKPTRTYYDHVVVHGATEDEVNARMDKLKEMWDQGVRFGKIHLLGSERALRDHEPSSGKRGANGHTSFSEMDMMENCYYAKSAGWPRELQQVRVFEVDSLNHDDGGRANTKDTVSAWIKTKPSEGAVLMISGQPCVKYQDAAAKAALPRGYDVETVGAEASRDVKISVAVDSIARQIDVGMERLKDRLKLKRSKVDAQLVLVDPKDINVDAASYQFRSGGDANGVTHHGRYKSQQWDAVLHGDPIMVHERLDGKIFVADGHHRVDLAKSLNQSGKGPGKLAAHVLREADGYSVKDVKIIAAYKNISHGKTDLVDTAKVFKEAYSGGVNVDLLPQLQMDKGNLKIAFTLSGLSDEALDMVKKKELEIDAAELLATKAKGNDAIQREVIAELKKQKVPQAYPQIKDSKPDTLKINMTAMAGVTVPKTMPGFIGAEMNRRAGSTQGFSLSA